ncbi:MAG: hypothetical protein J7647_16025 [Cyanobacteria bacterium SBLK]|nr:hypothetical protein [Cyanobacteria bacterium SBLK]
MKTRYAISAGLGLSLTFAGGVNAEGLRAKMKELDDRTQEACIAEVDRAIQDESSNHENLVRGEFTRKLFYTEPTGTIDIACFDEAVIVTVYSPEFDTDTATEVVDMVLGDIFPEE